MNKIANKKAIPPMVGVPALCLCSLTIGLSETSASSSVRLTKKVKTTVAMNVKKNNTIIYFKSILSHFSNEQIINKL